MANQQTESHTPQAPGWPVGANVLLPRLPRSNPVSSEGHKLQQTPRLGRHASDACRVLSTTRLIVSRDLLVQHTARPKLSVRATGQQQATTAPHSRGSSDRSEECGFVSLWLRYSAPNHRLARQEMPSLANHLMPPWAASMNQVTDGL